MSIKLFLISLLPLLPIVFTFVIYSGLFYSVLGRLGVKEKRISRGNALAVVLLVATISGNLVASIIHIPIIDIVAYAICLVFVFYVFAHTKLILKPWQVVALPLGVLVVGQVMSTVLISVTFASLK